MSDPRKKMGWRFWAVFGLIALLLYVGSIGPVWSVAIHHKTPAIETAFKIVYCPILFIADHSPLGDTLGWYLDLFDPED